MAGMLLCGTLALEHVDSVAAMRRLLYLWRKGFVAPWYVCLQMWDLCSRAGMEPIFPAREGGIQGKSWEVVRLDEVLKVASPPLSAV